MSQPEKTVGNSGKVAEPDKMGFLHDLKAKARDLKIDKYKDYFASKYEKIHGKEMIYENLRNAQTFLHEKSIMEKINTSSVDNLKAFQAHLHSQKQQLASYFKDAFGVSEKYVEDIVLPKLDNEVRFIIDNRKQFDQYSQNTEFFLLNHTHSVRNSVVGVVLISSDSNLEETLRNILYAISAGNTVALSLGDTLNQSSSLQSLFASFEKERPDSFRLVPDTKSLDDLSSEHVGLISVIGKSETSDRLEAIAANRGIPIVSLESGTNLCVVAKRLESANLNWIVNGVFNNKFELGGRSQDAIHQIMVPRKFSELFLQKLEILIEREFENKKKVESYYGKVDSEGLKSDILEHLNPSEIYNTIENEAGVIDKPPIIIDPLEMTWEHHIGKYPVFVVRRYDSKEELLKMMHEADKKRNIQNVHFFSSIEDSLVAQQFSLKLPCKAFHLNSFNPYVRTVSNANSPLLPYSGIIGGANTYGLYSRPQTVTRKLWSGLEKYHLYPLTTSTAEVFKSMLGKSMITKRHLLGTGIGLAALWFYSYRRHHSKKARNSSK